jgi:hypothetical protein
LGIVAVMVFVAHQYVVFIRHDPEYKRVYPEARLPGYWTPYGEVLPRGGYFGFPYRAGWNEVRGLYLDGTLSGDYDSNEEELITGWYTWGAVRCAEAPSNYLVSWRPQDEEDIPYGDIENEYGRRAVISVDGQEKLWAWVRGGSGEQALRLDDRGSRASVGGAASPLANRPLAVSQALGMPLPMVELDTAFENGSRLTGVDFPVSIHLPEGGTAPRSVSPGDSLSLVMIWHADRQPDANYSVFVHLVDVSGETVAQSDGWPDCGSSPTATWRPGEVVFDGHVLALPEDVNPGLYQLRAGQYDATTGRRSRVVAEGAAGDQAGDSVLLAEITVDGA